MYKMILFRIDDMDELVPLSLSQQMSHDIDRSPNQVFRKIRHSVTQRALENK